MSDKDTIYRQDAIDAIMSEPPDAHYPSWYADILWKLPSAEKAQLSEEDATFDCISRQDAKDAVDMALDTIDHVPEWVYDVLLNSLDKVPSAELPSRCVAKIEINKEYIEELVAEKVEKIKEMLKSQSERKKGKWLRSGSAIFPCECDQCGDTTERNTPFCPHCGADMTGGEEE